MLLHGGTGTGGKTYTPKPKEEKEELSREELVLISVLIVSCFALIVFLLTKGG